MTIAILSHPRKQLFFVLATTAALVAAMFIVVLPRSRAGAALNEANRKEIEKLTTDLSAEKTAAMSLSRRVAALNELAKILPPFISTGLANNDARPNPNALRLMNAITDVSAEMAGPKGKTELPLDCDDCTAFNAVLLVLDHLRTDLKPGFNELAPSEMYEVVKKDAHRYRPGVDALKTGDVVLVTLRLEHITPGIEGKNVFTLGHETMLFAVQVSDSDTLLYGYTPAGLSLTELKPTSMMKIFRPFNDQFACQTASPTPLAMHHQPAP